MMSRGDVEQVGFGLRNGDIKTIENGMSELARKRHQGVLYYKVFRFWQTEPLKAGVGE
jgi:hypothetical protein